MRADTQKSEVNKERKLTSMKKSNLPSDPRLCLAQLQVWAQLECAGEAFSKVFLVSDSLALMGFWGNTFPAEKKDIGARAPGTLARRDGLQSRGLS